MSVVSLSGERERRESEAWDRYVEAKNRADHTLALEDGQAAARAWCVFLDLIMNEAQAAYMGATVVPMRKRS